MTDKPIASIQAHFSELTDPRRDDSRTRHKLIDMIVIALCTHWSIENSCHWVLDVGFKEDACRIRKRNRSENLAILRRIALNLLKSEKTAKLGVANKRLKAAWDNDYLVTVLSTLF